MLPARSLLIANLTFLLTSFGCGGDIGDGGADASTDDTPSGQLTEAETGNNRTSVDMLHAWVDADTEVGFRGAGYVEALPNDGESCGEFTQCGASVSYNIDVEQTGTYFVYFRVWADDVTDDSIAWSVNAGPGEILVQTQLGEWQWIRSQTAITAQPGPLVFTIHMTEDGEKLDAFVLSTDGDQ